MVVKGDILINSYMIISLEIHSILEQAILDIGSDYLIGFYKSFNLLGITKKHNFELSIQTTDEIFVLSFNQWRKNNTIGVTWYFQMLRIIIWWRTINLKKGTTCSKQNARDDLSLIKTRGPTYVMNVGFLWVWSWHVPNQLKKWDKVVLIHLSIAPLWKVISG